MQKTLFYRKLILLIKNPLCHCGKATWDYGYLLNFFTTDFHKFLPNGIEVYYKSVPNEITQKIKTAFTLDTKKFSELVFVDEELNTPENAKHIRDFCHARLQEKFDIKSYEKHEYMYLHKTNASRCLYNFYTTKENVELNKYESMGFIRPKDIDISIDDLKLDFENVFQNNFSKTKIISLIKKYVPNFEHIETGKHLDQKM